MSDENKRLIAEITEVIWNNRGLDRIPEFYTPDFVADYRPYGPGREGHDGIRGMVDDLIPQPNWPEGHAEKVTLLIGDLERQPGFVATKLAWASGLMILVRRDLRQAR